MKSVGFVCGDLYMSAEAIRLIPAEKTLFPQCIWVLCCLFQQRTLPAAMLWLRGCKKKFLLTAFLSFPQSGIGCFTEVLFDFFFKLQNTNKRKKATLSLLGSTPGFLLPVVVHILPRNFLCSARANETKVPSCRRTRTSFIIDLHMYETLYKTRKLISIIFTREQKHPVRMFPCTETNSYWNDLGFPCVLGFYYVPSSL